MNASGIGLALVGALVIAGWLGARIALREARVRRQRIGERDAIPPRVRLRQFLKEVRVTEEEAVRILTMIATAYDVEVERIALEDRFDRELRFGSPPLVDEARSDLSRRVATELKARGVSADLSQVESVADLLRLYAERET